MQLLLRPVGPRLHTLYISSSRTSCSGSVELRCIPWSLSGRQTAAKQHATCCTVTVGSDHESLSIMCMSIWHGDEGYQAAIIDLQLQLCVLPGKLPSGSNQWYLFPLKRRWLYHYYANTITLVNLKWGSSSVRWHHCSWADKEMYTHST